MPLLPQTRTRDDIAPLEDLVNRCVAEATEVVGSTCEHMTQLRSYKRRLTRVRMGFDQARESA
ncbi:hypothetical protein [Streptomyces sp. NPDC002088]|uniref:hypothetical protein n=1 Tax=Streptomyces sp. NPDC002088 TaxID=3154665 RepID=UPI00331870EE